MPPAGGFVDRQRALMVAAVKVAVGTHVFPHRDGVAQFGLEKDLNGFALLGEDLHHLGLPLFKLSVTAFPFSQQNLEHLFYIFYERNADLVAFGL
jgi:hypothetical protein